MKRLMLAVATMFAFLMVPVSASASDLTPIGPDAQQADSAFLDLSPFLVTTILGTIIPLITGLLTKLSTPAWVKAVLTAALSTVAGALNVSLVDGGGAVVSQSTVISAVLTFIVAVATYAGFWRPLAVSSSPVTHVDESGNLVTEPGKLATVGVK
jgi:hypothetical protein